MIKFKKAPHLKTNAMVYHKVHKFFRLNICEGLAIGVARPV